MERIASFNINHLELFPGLYVSRRDRKGDCTVTTFDMRLTAPNREPVVDVPALHTIEHMAATYLRNSDLSEEQRQERGYRLFRTDGMPDRMLSGDVRRSGSGRYI